MSTAWRLTSERPLAVVDLGRLSYPAAFKVQGDLAATRKCGEGVDTLLFVEHPHVVTLGRNAQPQHVLASEEILLRSGIALYESDRGGDVTYHGPGQVVGYPILDLKQWKCDVHAYFHGLEQVLIDAFALLGIQSERIPEKGYEGVWVNGAKLAAIGVHISRWVTSHGFAINVDTDLSFFGYIVPCGLAKPVCSLRSLGCSASHEELKEAVVSSFGKIFGYQVNTDQPVGKFQEI